VLWRGRRGVKRAGLFWLGVAAADAFEDSACGGFDGGRGAVDDARDVAVCGHSLGADLAGLGDAEADVDQLFGV